MKRVLLALLLAFVPLSLVQAEVSQPQIGARDPKIDPMLPYYGNTYTCYWPGAWECHHWWDADGSEIFFSTSWSDEGLLTLRMTDGKFETFVANGQWCSHNAKTVIAAGTPLSRSLRSEDEAVDHAPDPQITNNNRNGCSPIVDAVPGDHWYKLHLNGRLSDNREEYTLMPGHQ